MATEGLHRHPRLLFFLRYWLPLIGYVGLIFTLSAQPNLQSPLPFENSDKLIHACEYGLLGLLLHALARASRPERPAAAVALVALAAGMAIGACDENFQRLTPGRSCDLFDWFADTAGVTAAQVIALAWARHRED